MTSSTRRRPSGSAAATRSKRSTRKHGRGRERLDTYHNLAKSLGTTDSAEVATQRALLLDHLGTLRAQQTQLQRDIALIDAELAVIDAKARARSPSSSRCPRRWSTRWCCATRSLANPGRPAGLERDRVAGPADGRGPNDPSHQEPPEHARQPPRSDGAAAGGTQAADPHPAHDGRRQPPEWGRSRKPGRAPDAAGNPGPSTRGGHQGFDGSRTRSSNSARPTPR